MRRRTEGRTRTLLSWYLQGRTYDARGRMHTQVQSAERYLDRKLFGCSSNTPNVPLSNVTSHSVPSPPSSVLFSHAHWLSLCVSNTYILLLEVACTTTAQGFGSAADKISTASPLLNLPRLGAIDFALHAGVCRAGGTAGPVASFGPRG